MSNLPLMSESQLKEAPFNQRDIPVREFNVTCCQSLSKTVKVLTDNYVPREDDKELIIDTGGTNWADEYHSNDYHTPIQLIGLFAKYLKEEIEHSYVDSPYKTLRLQKLLEECNDWTEDETEYINQ